MGFSFRKSFKVAPGVRMTLSKSGVGYSVGGKGGRITKRARGGVQTTLRVPGTGLSYTASASTGTGKHAKPRPAETPSKKTRRRDEATGKPQRIHAGQVNITAAVLTTGKPRRSRRRATRNNPSPEVQPPMSEPTPQVNQTPPADRVAEQPPRAHLDLSSPRAHREFRIAGRWYYLVLIATAGLFAWVPFLHAAVRLRTARARWLTVIFGGLDALIYVLVALTPQNSQGQAANGPLSTVGGLLALGTIIVGCVLVAPLRRMAYEGAPTGASEDVSTADPAITAALAARARRDVARKLAADDPLLARELHVGRPDITRTYDDGGLVDLNNAPAEVIADMCGIPVDVAVTITDARYQRGEPFANVDELFVMADVPVSTWDRIRDRAVLLP
jgi:hypothetical protein